MKKQLDLATLAAMMAPERKAAAERVARAWMQWLYGEGDQPQRETKSLHDTTDLRRGVWTTPTEDEQHTEDQRDDWSSAPTEDKQHGEREREAGRAFWREAIYSQPLQQPQPRTPDAILADMARLAREVGQTQGIPARARVELERLKMASAADPYPSGASESTVFAWKTRESRRAAERRKWRAELE